MSEAIPDIVANLENRVANLEAEVRARSVDERLSMLVELDNDIALRNHRFIIAYIGLDGYGHVDEGIHFRDGSVAVRSIKNKETYEDQSMQDLHRNRYDWLTHNDPTKYAIKYLD